ncbi:MAG: hypothetical protein EA376_00210 [Phycisphaeraceae bacterium]|nr:MAG: hypothetical protein EA376_00210 [Phycisphaeraceae bacterium]
MRGRILDAMADFILARPWWIITAALILAALAGAHAAINLDLNADTDDLIASDRPFMSEYRRFLEDFGDLEYIYIVVDAGRDREQGERCVVELVRKLREIEALPGVSGWIEPAEQLRIATRAMPENELEGLARASEAIPLLLSKPDAAAAIETASAMLRRALAPDAPQERREAMGAAAVLALEQIASTPEMAMAGDEPLPRRFLESDTGRMLFVEIMPVKDYGTLAVIAEPLRQIRAVMDEVRPQFPDVEIGLTGRPALQADELATSDRDMRRAATLALLLCSGLIILALRTVVRPLLAVGAFLMAGAWTYGAATVMIGHLNLLSVVFVLVLVGVGLDYGVHMISRFNEFRAKRPLSGALRGVMRTAATGNITGALTSCAVFFMALFTDFQGLRELGLIAGVGLLLCLVAMSFVLPALFVATDRTPQTVRGDMPTPIELPMRRFERALIDRPWHVLALVGVISALLAVLPGGAGFEYNLLELQSEGLEAVEWEERIRKDSVASTWFGAVIVDEMHEIPGVLARSDEMETIGAGRSVLDIVRLDTPERRRWRDKLQEAADAPAPVDPMQAGDAGRVRRALDDALPRVQGMAELARMASPEDALALKSLHARLVERRRALDEDPESTLARINEALDVAGERLRIMLDGDALPLREALPDALREQFISKSGRFLVMLHPREDVWEYEPMERFVADLRAVDPDVTGVPITHFESLGEMRDGFVRMSLLAILCVTVFLMIDFRRIVDTLFTLIALGLGVLWTVEAMGALGVSFNLANFFALPLLIGLGVDGSVHILHRYHEQEDTERRFQMGATRRAVILTAVTTAVGFGCLLIAQHRGLRSLGVMMIIGSVACMAASVLILPALLSARDRVQGTLARRRGERSG